MGVEDDDYAEFLDLATLRLDPKRIGVTAARTVLQMVEGGGEPAAEIAVEGGVGDVQRRRSTLRLAVDGEDGGAGRDSAGQGSGEARLLPISSEESNQ